MTVKKKDMTNLRKYMIGTRKVDISPGPWGSPVPPWREAPQLQCPEHHI